MGRRLRRHEARVDIDRSRLGAHAVHPAHEVGDSPASRRASERWVISHGRGPREDFADEFAGEFLMPSEGIRRFMEEAGMPPRITEDVDVIHIQRYFRVSFPTALVRLKQMNAITAATYPEDRTLPDEALRHSDLLSEMRQAARHYEAAERTGGTTHLRLDRVLAVDKLYDTGVLQVVDMTVEELVEAADLQSRSVTTITRYGHHSVQAKRPA
jgi:hypothetical protein